MNNIFDLEGKTALVTGGSRGIGHMIASGLVEAGVRVFITSRNAEACAMVARQLSQVGSCEAIPADLSSREGCESMVTEMRNRTGALDLLVNNAGAIWNEPLETFPASAWDKVLDLNLKAPFFLIQLLLPLLEDAGDIDDPSRVINIGSVYGLQSAVLNTYSYAASKAALHHLTKVMARELGPRGITVNAIAPGPFESRMYAPPPRSDRDEVDCDDPPLARLGTAEDIVGAVRFLASRAGAFVTGAVIPVDGGRSTTR